MIYFDNAASTPLSQKVKAVLTEEMEHFANPSSLHRLGFEQEKRLKKAREIVARSIGALPEEVFFTSGGTEADNLAILGAAKKLRRRGNRILAANSEHHAVTECLSFLEKEGFEVVYLSTKGGALSEEEIREKANDKTILALCMHTNNETGARYDVKMLSRVVKEKSPHALIFCDGVQGYLKTPFAVKNLGVDLLSLSSHKICGPKGVGALYMKKGTALPPQMLGGGQEKGIRSGTENLLGILGFAAAAEEGFASLSQNLEKMAEIRNMILEEVKENPKICPNIPSDPSCHILSLQVKGFRSEVLLHTLSQKDVFVSSGSACSSHSGKSGVLSAFGLTNSEADCTIRLSFSPLSTLEEAKDFCKILKEIVR